MTRSSGRGKITPYCVRSKLGIQKNSALGAAAHLDMTADRNSELRVANHNSEFQLGKSNMHLLNRPSTPNFINGHLKQAYVSHRLFHRRVSRAYVRLL